MAGFFTLVLALLGNYAGTPQQAAMRVFYAPASRQRAIERTNIVGRYATVLVRGGVMEGSLVRAPILVERFSFGWQALDVLNFRCRLEEHAIPRGGDELVMRGMPNAQDDRPCTGVGKDGGPQAQVEAVRRQMRGPLVPYVVVPAITQWASGTVAEEGNRCTISAAENGA